MHCPFCSIDETKVIDSRLVGEGTQVRRRRECTRCNERFTTYESAELMLPRVIKRDNRRFAFDEDKLRAGMLKALEKRPVSVETFEKSIAHLKKRLRAFGEREIDSRLLGEWVMEELQQLDQVAFVRFASVYRCFEDVDAFQEEIKRLQQLSANPKAETMPPTEALPKSE